MKTIIQVLFILLAANSLHSQTKLSEGKIIYNVFVDSLTDSAQGVLTVTLRQAQMKRELIMNNGFKNTIIHNVKLNKTTTFSQLASKKIAKILSTQEQEKNNLQFENATYDTESTDKNIAGYAAQAMKVTYANGTVNNVYYTNDYTPALSQYNSMFPQIKGLPLQYEVTSGQKKLIFVAKSILIEPVNNSEFEALKGFEWIK